MDMGSSSTSQMMMASMNTMSSTASSMAAASPTSAMSMGGMDMSGGMSSADECQISMLWNWYTIDACFISSTWHITSNGMFAGSCIGVISLAMSLAFLKRLHRAVDAAIARSARAKFVSPPPYAGFAKGTESPSGPMLSKGDRSSAGPVLRRPTVLQQLCRAFLHMTQFAVAYFIMLLAMYFNGYIIISILIGAFLGYFVFEWQPVANYNLAPGPLQEDAVEVTGCCG